MENLFLELLKLSLIGTLFAVAVMAVRLVFRKAPKWIFVALWGVVALRLILPVSVESKASVVPESLTSGEVITQVRDTYIGPIEYIYEDNFAYPDVLEAGGQPIYSQQGNYIVTQKDTMEPPKTFGETVLPVLGWVWLAGVALMIAYTAASYFLLKRKMAVATLLRDNIWQCEAADMPFVLGVFRPKIYLPYWIKGEDFDYVIAHEQAHIARRDHWWKPFGFFLLSVHWFNPVLWVAYILLCRDIEAACDEKVIAPMDKERVRAYSTALLNCSVRRRRIAACPLAFGETGVKERIRHVMNYKKPAFWLVLAAVVIAAALIICFCTNPLKKEENPEPTETVATEQTITEDKENTNKTGGSTAETTGNTTENKDNSDNENTGNADKDNTDKENTGTGNTIDEDDAIAKMIESYQTVLTGPVTQYVQVDNSRTVVYTADLTNRKIPVPVSLPKFLPFSADAIACQAGFENDLKFHLARIDEAVTNKYDASPILYMNFDAFLNGDVLSVVIQVHNGYAMSYYSYNFDVTTGKQLSNEALAEKLQITNLTEMLTRSAKAAYEAHWGTTSTDKNYIERLNATIDPENIAKAQVYLNQDGKLKAGMYIGSLAGAAGYNELISVS